jgi:uncharacterized protein YndB with AHSA1/START domain
MIRVMALVIAAVLTAQTSPVAVQKLTSPEKALRFEVVAPAPVDAVWTAFSTQAGLQTWLWSDVQVDLKPGGDWLVRFPGRAGSPPSTGGGTIVSFVPGQRLEIRALAPDQFPTVRRERTTALFEFQPITPGSTRVTLTQTGWKTGPEWDAAYEYLAGGNAELLTQLLARFTSGPIDWTKLK